MDQPALPSAAELGVSDAEYATILRDLQLRQGLGGAPPPTPLLEGRTKVLLLALVGLVLAFVLVPRLVGGGDDEPAYAFMDTVGGKPVAYSSCRPIQVAVYPAGGPPDAEQLVRDAVGRMRSATGLDIVVTGAFGGHAPNWNFEAAPVHPDDPISISWQDGDAIAELTDHTAGLGGSRVMMNPDGSQRRVAGTIALSRDYYAYLTQRGDRDEALAVLLHEFGHVLGLDHVDSRNELMNADNTGRTTFGAGDLQGLRMLGQGRCF